MRRVVLEAAAALLLLAPLGAAPAAAAQAFFDGDGERAPSASNIVQFTVGD